MNLVIVFIVLEPKPRGSWSWGRFGWTGGAVPGLGGCTADMTADSSALPVTLDVIWCKENKTASLSFRLLR